VTNVVFLTNNVAITNVRVAPFNLSVSNFAPGFYSVTARATDNAGANTTSAAVSVRVVAPPRLSLVPPSGGPIAFQFNTDQGANYVIERATAVTNFSAVVTNPGNGSVFQFSAPANSPPEQYYRVRVQP
jgi:hypothetical protein